MIPRYKPGDSEFKRCKVRILTIEPKTGRITVLVPSWHPFKAIALSTKDLPAVISDKLEVDQVLSVRVNENAVGPNQIQFREWKTLADEVE